MNRIQCLFVLASSLACLAPRASAQDDPSPPTPLFQPRNAELGLSYPMPDEPGVALLDFNRDGHVDLIIGLQIWRNDRRRRFSSAYRLPGPYYSFGDFNNDGKLDIYVTSPVDHAQAKGVNFDHWLLRCDGDGRYTDILKDSGLPTAGEPPSPYNPYPKHDNFSKAHGFLDYDNDGNLDLFIAGHQTSRGKGVQKRVQKLPDRLYRGDGQGKFVDATEAAGLASPPRPAVGVAFCDFDLDGFTDIYVANAALTPNSLWHNQGDGTFADIATAVGACGGAASSFSVVCVDFDHDGDFDIFLVNHAAATPEKQEPRSVLLRNEFIPEGQLRFTDVTAELGLDWAPPAGFRPQAMWVSAAWADFNNNGYHDLFVTESCDGGYNHPEIPLKLGRLDSGYSRLFLNDQNRRFVRADTARNNLRIEDSWGCAAADVDNDGWLDLLVGSHTIRKDSQVTWFDPRKQRAVFLHHRGLSAATGQPPGPQQRYLNVTLTARDRSLTGAVVEVILDDGERRRALLDTSFGGYATGSNQLHFGLADRRVTEIITHFPGRDTVSFKGNWQNTTLLVDVSRDDRQPPRTVSRWE
jgi:hypothetical protein